MDRKYKLFTSVMSSLLGKNGVPAPRSPSIQQLFTMGCVCLWMFPGPGLHRGSGCNTLCHLAGKQHPILPNILPKYPIQWQTHPARLHCRTLVRL